MVLLEHNLIISSRDLLYEEKKQDKTKEVWRDLWISSHLHLGVIQFKNYSLTYLGNTCTCPLAETYMRRSIPLPWLYCQNEPAATYDTEFAFLYRANFVLHSCFQSLCSSSHPAASLAWYLRYTYESGSQEIKWSYTSKNIPHHCNNDITMCCGIFLVT